jgi:hypothetical protein
VAFQGRQTTPRNPKYVSVSYLKEYVWPLDSALFKVYDRNQRLYIVEGVFDVLGAMRLGFPAVCSFGKSISDKQIQLIKELCPGEVSLAWDSDAKTEIKNTVKRLQNSFSNTLVCTLKGSIDPGTALNGTDEEKLFLKNAFEAPIHTSSPQYFNWVLQ